ncbi:hypothetical protein Tco_0452627 [Tanacetum coccineum]
MNPKVCVDAKKALENSRQLVIVDSTHRGHYGMLTNLSNLDDHVKGKDSPNNFIAKLSRVRVDSSRLTGARASHPFV